jgi:hypothetical protein
VAYQLRPNRYTKYSPTNTIGPVSLPPQWREPVFAFAVIIVVTAVAVAVLVVACPFVCIPQDLLPPLPLLLFVVVVCCRCRCCCCCCCCRSRSRCCRCCRCCCCCCRCRRSSSSPPKPVISTEADHGLIVSGAAEKTASLPIPSPSQSLPVLLFVIPQRSGGICFLPLLFWPIPSVKING